MILIGQFDSPPTRRVGVALHHYGIPFTRDRRSIFADAAEIGRISPLTRIPALVLDDGAVLIDSAAILDFLDEKAGDAALCPRHGPVRQEILQMTALAQGVVEKAAAVVYETHYHGEGASKPWIDRCLGQARAGLDTLAARLAGPFACGDSLSHADVMITTMVWYLNDRVTGPLDHAAHAPLIALAARCETLPAFIAAAVSPDEKMPRR